MPACCVDGCIGPKDEDAVFFGFPTSRLLRKRWLDAINCSSKVAQDAVICVRHFDYQDYELIRGKIRLKSRVVPSLLVGDKPNNNENTETPQETTEAATNDKPIREKTTETNNDNEKVHNDNEGNGKVDNDNENNGKINKDNEINGKVNNKEDIEHVQSESPNTKNVNENTQINKDNIIPNNTEINTHDNNSTGNNDSEIVKNDNEKIENNDKDANNTGKINTDNAKVDNDNGKRNNERVQNDNGKVQSKGRKTRCKITAMRAVNGRRNSSNDSDSSTDSNSSSPLQPELEGSKDDIEGILTHYYIENKKTERQVAAMTDVLQEEERRGEGGAAEGAQEWGYEQSAPVFIEVSVGHGSNKEEQAENDCLMVMESVQCDVDPALLLQAREDEEIEEVDLAGDDDDDDVEAVVKKKEDPISLLTSSDEDDVILEEPHIDTVEVSSADTSEDDMPLMKLVKPKAKTKTVAAKKEFASAKRTKSLITKLLWGGTDFYCVHCRFTTVNASDYNKHMAEHSKVLQLCQDCGFTTCSKAQMNRHKQKHKNERRFKCQRCNYSAKHKMSLVYHMKSHSVTEVELAICDVEPASKMSRMSGASRMSDASRMIVSEKSVKHRDKSVKKHNCESCDYKTNRRSDLRRHRNRLHKGDSSDEESEEQ